MEFEETPGFSTKLPVSHVGFRGLVITCLFLFLNSPEVVLVQSPEILSSTQMLPQKQTCMVDTPEHGVALDSN